MKSFAILCVFAFVAIASGQYLRGPGDCEPGEMFYADCSLESICDILPSPVTYNPQPICGCRCAPLHSRDLITGLCRPTNALGQC